MSNWPHPSKHSSATSRMSADPDYRWRLSAPPSLPEDPRRRHQIIEREINRLIPWVVWALREVDAPTSVSWKEDEYDRDAGKRVMRTIRVDLISQCLQDAPGAGGRADQIHQARMACIEQGIGIYEGFADRAVARWWNPFYWLVALVRLPISDRKS